MPEQRLKKARESLPSGYQFGDALDPRMRRLMDEYGGCKYSCGRGVTLCAAFPCEEREAQRAATRLMLASLFAPETETEHVLH